MKVTTRLVRGLLLVGFVAGTSLSAAASLTCSVHVAGPAGYEYAGGPGDAHESGHGRHTDHDAEHDQPGHDEHGEHDCSCLGACCPGTSVSPIRADAGADFVTLVAHSPGTVRAESPRYRVARLLPFANAPPREF